MSAPLTEQAASLQIEATTRALHLPTVRQQAGPLAEAALRDRLSHRAYLDSRTGRCGRRWSGCARRGIR